MLLFWCCFITCQKRRRNIKNNIGKEKTENKEKKWRQLCHHLKITEMIHVSANQLNDFYILVALTLYGLVMIFLWPRDGQKNRKKRDLHWSIPFINSDDDFLVNIFTVSLYHCFFYISLFKQERWFYNHFQINPFSTNVPITNKPGNWFLLPYR